MTQDQLTPARNAPAAKTPPSAPAAPSSAAAKPAAVPHSTSALIAAAGLPADKLSAAIVSFARFFSLPLKPELMAAIRRQALAPATPSTATQAESVKLTAAETVRDTAGIAAKTREALALAAAAAESKGIELHPKGLESFAEVIDPDAASQEAEQRRQERDRHERRNKNHEERENSPKSGPITAASLREMALESAEKDPLLAILNRLPGKNGQRWVVLPFSFCEEGRKFNVSLKILLETDKHASDRPVYGFSGSRMILDIAGENDRSWLFVLDNRGMKTHTAFGSSRLAVYLQPKFSPTACTQFAGELSRLMDIPPERISIRSRTEAFPCEAGAGDDPVDALYSIDEAV